MAYLLSRYTYEVDRGLGDEGEAVSLIYNSFSDSLAQVPTTLFEAIKSTDLEYMKKHRREIRSMAEEGFLITEDQDELTELHDWYNTYIKSKDCLEVTLLLSYRCNFGCPYCFESKYLGNVRMPEEIQQGIVNWVRNELVTNKIPSLFVTFFGGEPLVERELLFKLAKQMRAVCAELGAHFEFALITNGYHLKRELYEEMTQLGLVHVKVTLDGDKETHDKQRPMRGGQGSFEHILGNLKDIGVLSSFTIGGNFNSKNEGSVDSIFRLLDRLKAEGLDKSVGRFAFKPIQDAKLESTNSMVTSMADGEMHAFLRIEEELQKRRLPRIRRVDPGPCDALKEHSIAIDPKGDLYPCGAFAGDKRACIGNVVTGKSDNYDHVMGYSAFKNPKCNSCQFLPGCFGSCRWVALLQKGDYQGENCSKTYFETTVKTLLKMEAGFNLNQGKEVNHEDHPQRQQTPTEERPSLFTGANLLA